MRDLRWGRLGVFNAARELICAANGNGKPLVFDSFSGYGAIPRKPRASCESMAFDLNPVAVLCMKTLIESAPQYGYVLIENIKTGLSLLSKRQRNGWKGIILSIKIKCQSHIYGHELLPAKALLVERKSC